MALKSFVLAASCNVIFKLCIKMQHSFLVALNNMFLLKLNNEVMNQTSFCSCNQNNNTKYKWRGGGHSKFAVFTLDIDDSFS